MESNSVSNQRDLLFDYISNHKDFVGSNIIEFCDDGYSGTNFERPAVQKLLEKVKKKEIECIIVKDFSRFGRNYLELGDYLEQVFPFLGIRFISVNDGYDNARDNGVTAGLDIGLKNLIYDLYSKDLSQKVKSGKLAKMNKGEYIGSFPHYGYMKDKFKKNSLVVDRKAAVIIKRIFKLAAESNNTSEIAKILNSEEVLSPAKRYQQLYQNKKWKNKDTIYWYSMAVIKILRDEIYLGKTINHKRESKIVGSKKNVAVSKEEWVTVSNTHEAIISEKDFEEAQNLRKSQVYQEKLNVIKIEEYEKYLDGKISKEEYLDKRDKLSADIEKIAVEISNLQTSYEALIKRKD